jgi:hypothetical protein
MQIKLEYLDTIVVEDGVKKIHYIVNSPGRFQPKDIIDTDKENVLTISRNYNNIFIKDGYKIPDFNGFCTAMHGKNICNK